MPGSGLHSDYPELGTGRTQGPDARRCEASWVCRGPRETQVCETGAPETPLTSTLCWKAARAWALESSGRALLRQLCHSSLSAQELWA